MGVSYTAGQRSERIITEFHLEKSCCDLTTLGKTNPVTLTAEQFNCYESPMFDGATVCGGDFSATLDRTQWGMDYIVGPIPAEVQLSIQVEGIKQ